MSSRETSHRQCRQREFVERLNASFPGFLNAIQPGGDKHEPWKKYQRYNAGTITNALDTGDYDTLAYHIRNFYSSFLGVSVPSATDGATPEPRNFAGGGSSQNLFAGDGREYTVKEYQDILGKAQADFHAHRISYQRYEEICGELSTAFKEGRVK